MWIGDIFWMMLILGGAGWIFYRSVVKKKGHCPGCDDGSCK